MRIQNRVVWTKKTVRNYYDCRCYKNTAAKICYPAFAMLLAAVVIICLVRQKYDTLVLMALGIPVLVGLFFIRRASNISLLTKQLAETGRVLPFSVLTTYTNEGIRSENEKTHNVYELSYDEITRIAESKQMLILICGTTSGVVLDKSGFVEGTKEEFRALLKSQRPDLKI